MICPHCHLENPPETWRCDCGYDFRDGSDSGANAIVDPRRNGAGGGIVVSVFIGGISGALIGAVGGVKAAIALYPDSNLMPFMIFIVTAPLGSILGIAGGALCWKWLRAAESQN